MAFISQAKAVVAARPFPHMFAMLSLALLVGGALPSIGRSATLTSEGLLPHMSASVPVAPVAPAWSGADVDGDGAADFTNPTGRAPRIKDAYGSGAFEAQRDGGERRHEGVDYVSTAGQAVDAPMAGVVTKVGYAYAGDDYRYVEISNPATHYSARVFYVQPTVKVGDQVTVGESLGSAETLQHRYRGITDHVHLEILKGARHLDPATLIHPGRTILAQNGAPAVG